MTNEKKELKKFILSREERWILCNVLGICSELQEKYSLIHGQRSEAIISATNKVILGLKKIRKTTPKSPEVIYMEKVAEIDIWKDDKTK